MKTEPQEEHAWLHRLVGEWTYESESPPARKGTGAERVRSLGGLWVLAEGEGEMPGGEAATSVMTLGFDPQRGRYVGTWIGSMMTHLWVYDGEMDAEHRVLTLTSVGPAMSGREGTLATYRDVIEWQNDDHRLLRALVLDEDGGWREFMTVHYRRTT